MPEIDLRIGRLIGPWLRMSAVFSVGGAGWIVYFVSSPVVFPNLISQVESKLDVNSTLDLLFDGRLLSNEFLSNESLALIDQHFLIIPHAHSLVVEHGLIVNKTQISGDFERLFLALTGAWQCQFLMNSPAKGKHCLNRVCIPMLADILCSSEQILHWMTERRYGSV